MRTLCTIQKIKEVQSIDGKDRIKYLSFEDIGFKVIGSSELQVGDLVIYIESDTLLPVKPEFEFLRSRCYNEKLNKFRIKCMKMSGLFSEGIVFPLHILPCNKTYKVGQDVTSLIGAVKYDDYEAEEVTAKPDPFKSFMFKYFRFIANIIWKKKPSMGNFPSFASKTDETRVQNLQYIFDKFQHLIVYISTKIDGQSATYALYKNEFYITSRNVTLERRKVGTKDKANSKYHQTAIKYKIEEALLDYKKRTGHDIYIQGEQAGEGIQGNKLGLKGIHFFIFNIKDTTTNSYFCLNDLRQFCERYNIPLVPIVGVMPFDFKNVDELVEFSKGNYDNGTPREGIVIRSLSVLPAEKGMANMFSFKVINPDFQLKYGL